MLGRTAGYPVKLGLGNLQLAVVQGPNRLYRTLAEGLWAYNQVSTVILDGGGKDFRSRGTHAGNQQHQRAVVNHGGVFVVLNLHVFIGVANLNCRALIDEQADQVVGFVQGAATVVAPVHHHAIDTVFLQFADQPANVPGGAFVIGITCLHGLEIGIEGGNGDHANAIVLALTFQFDHFLAGALFFQLDFVPADTDRPGNAFVRGVGRNHFQGDG